LSIRSLDYPSTEEIGLLIPVRCGHRSHPKDFEKEKKALDNVLRDAGFNT